ncbi:helix-turn-helix domain-containing protein [Saccharopolyspora sp. K220]|uniref:helix-turn-helix domain-containing protein n=1 Tax=Saccharopolyspora soli TaxID=2926618 RepID=UPI001F5873FF|nr:helix-turn-helix domain-containing protein [Saccharopolyspora soli]MCI2417229.1 helix-turn-helix domain-containing protein [Saccharopolyspora soli]
MQVVTATPPPRLRSLITDCTGYRVRSAPGVHHGLPSRSLTVVISLDDAVDITPAAGPDQSLTALAAGLHAQAVRINHGELQHGIQLGLTPLGARALLGLPAGELVDSSVDLDVVLGPAATELAERLRAATTWSDRFTCLNDALLRLAAPAALPSPELGWIWRRMAQTDGHLPITALAAEVGWSRQHLGVQFRREFGLSPKLLARVMRFERARRLLIAGVHRSFADVATACGYADQAHFNRDWREFAGLSPSRWMAQDLPFVQGAAHLPDAS